MVLTLSKVKLVLYCFGIGNTSNFGKPSLKIGKRTDKILQTFRKCNTGKIFTATANIRFLLYMLKSWCMFSLKIFNKLLWNFILLVGGHGIIHHLEFARCEHINNLNIHLKISHAHLWTNWVTSAKHELLSKQNI